MSIERKPAPFITITVPATPWLQTILREEASVLIEKDRGSLSHKILDLAIKDMKAKNLISESNLTGWKQIRPQGGKTTPFTSKLDHRVLSIYIPKELSWIKQKLKKAAEIVTDSGEIKRSVSKYLLNLVVTKNMSRVLALQAETNKGKPAKDLKDFRQEWQEYLGAHLHKIHRVRTTTPSYTAGTGKTLAQTTPESATTVAIKAKKAR